MNTRWCGAAGEPLDERVKEHIAGSVVGTPFRSTGSRCLLGKNTKNKTLHRQTEGEISAPAAGSGWADDTIRQKVLGRTVSVAGRRKRRSGLWLWFGRAHAAFALLDEPARDQGVGVFVEPLVEEGRDLLAEIGGVAKAREFVGLQSVAGGGEKEFPRRLGALAGHEESQVR